MGNINSISKLNFEDMSKFINSKDAIIINTLETNNQSCLINGTLSPEEEINRLNLHLGQKNTKSVNVVIYGKNCSDLTIEVAAKTGTAQWSNDKLSHAWFTSFAPFDNPSIVVTVLVEEGEEGSRVASPVAKQIIKYYAENKLPQ